MLRQADGGEGEGGGLSPRFILHFQLVLAWMLVRLYEKGEDRTARVDKLDTFKGTDCLLGSWAQENLHGLDGSLGKPSLSLACGQP